MATTKEGSGVVLVKEPCDVLSETEQLPQGDEEAATVPCSWWRQGRVELGLKHGLAVLVVISWLENPRFTTRNEHCGNLSGSR